MQWGGRGNILMWCSQSLVRGFHFLVLCYYLQYLQPLTNESFYTTSFALLAVSACISSISCKFYSLQLVHTDDWLVLWMLTWLYFQFIYFIQQHSVLTLQFRYTLYLLYTISDISRRSCVLTSKLLGWIASHPSRKNLDDKVRRFSLYPPNVVRNRPNVRAVILSNNIIK